MGFMLELSQQNRPDYALEQEHGKSVLVVDDEAIIRDLCSKALKGYRIYQAGDGEEALKVFQKGEIDVILTDVMMPKMGGIELLKRLKEIEHAAWLATKAKLPPGFRAVLS